MTKSSRIERQITNLIRTLVDPGLVDADGTGVTGTPDLTSRYGRVAVFVDGCYWHGCAEHTSDPRADQRRARDAGVNAALAARGWAVLRVWEHEEHLAPFLATSAETVSKRAAERRDEILAHLASHSPGDWCQTCSDWPHEPIRREDGWCERCMVHASDHEYDATDWRLYGPGAKLPDRPPVGTWSTPTPKES